MTRRAFEHLKRSGDAEDLLRRAGLTLQGIEDPQARIGAESQIAFLKLASEALDDPLLGFHLAESFEPRELGLLYYVQASSATLGEALGRVARYSSVAHEGLAAKCVRGNALTFRIDYVGVPRHSDRHQMEFLITGLVRIFPQADEHSPSPDPGLARASPLRGLRGSREIPRPVDRVRRGP